MVTLMAVHGATFLTMRLPAAMGGHVARFGRRLVPAALAALTATTALGLLSDRVRHGVRQPVATVLLLALLAVALLLARTALARRRPGLAFTATSVALALPVPLIGVATWPHVLVSTADPAASLTVAEAAASGPTLQLLSWLVVPLLPALLGFQLMCWWMFRGRVDGRTPVFW
jgi:cytochrome d ubiquinol oxidase subunit II